MKKKNKKPVNKFKQKKKFKWTKSKTLVLILVVAFLGIVGSAVYDTLNQKDEQSLDKISVEGEYSEEVQEAINDYKPIVDEQGFQSRVTGYEENIEDITPCIKAFEDLSSYTLVTREYKDEEELSTVSIYEEDKEKGLSIYTITERSDDAYYSVISQVVTDTKKDTTYVLTQDEVYSQKASDRENNADVVGLIYKELINDCAYTGYDKDTLTFNGLIEDFSILNGVNYTSDYDSSLLRMACNKFMLPTSLSVYNLTDKSEILYTMIDIDEAIVEKPDWCVELDEQ